MVRSNVHVLKVLRCIFRIMFVKVRLGGELKENRNLGPSLSLFEKEREPGIEAERSFRFNSGGTLYIFGQECAAVKLKCLPQLF